MSHDSPPLALNATSASAGEALRSIEWLDSDCVKAAAIGGHVASQRNGGCDDSSPALYYEDSAVQIYHGDCRNYERLWFGLLLTDPPYPNGEGHFDDAVPVAREVIHNVQALAKMIFWSELETPMCGMAHVATHIWHRTNVNGKIYEPCYEFNANGKKRRSDVIKGAAIFKGAGAGCCEYLGHPTQKPLHVMRRLIELSRTEGPIFDPFMGSGSTLRAAKDLGRKAIGIEIEERYCEIAAKRMSQEVLNFTPSEPHAADLGGVRSGASRNTTAQESNVELSHSGPAGGGN